MDKNKILSKLNINIKDYNNELEKILENKLFSYDVKNLLLSMLYKIENAYKDYEIVKVEVPSKKEYIENLLRIIKEKCLKIFIVKVGTEEFEKLERKGSTYAIDRKNGEIICIQNELVILTAILKIDQSDLQIEMLNRYLELPLNTLLNVGQLDSYVEVIRDFNGWSWDIVTNDMNDIEYNYIYQTALLLNGKDNVNSDKYDKIHKLISKMAIEKYISDKKNKEYIKKFEEIKKEKSESLELFQNKKEFLNNITEEKKNAMKQIEKIDRILNNNELLKKEYYSRNEKLPNKEKIFSVSYLVEILIKERVDLIEKIEEYNKIILPKEFISQKEKLEEENEFLNSVKARFDKKDIIELSIEFLHIVKKIVNKIDEEDKSKLINWIYKIRYYRYLPISKNENIKDIKELDFEFEELIKLIIKKAQELKIWDTFSEDENVTYRILKEIFDSKIIYLQNVNIGCNYENKTLYVDFYDDTVIENSIKIDTDKVKIKKKIKLFI